MRVQLISEPPLCVFLDSSSSVWWQDGRMPVAASVLYMYTLNIFEPSLSDGKRPTDLSLSLHLGSPCGHPLSPGPAPGCTIDDSIHLDGSELGPPRFWCFGPQSKPPLSCTQRIMTPVAFCGTVVSFAGTGREESDGPGGRYGLYPGSW